MLRSLPVLIGATVVGGIACGLGYRGSLEMTSGIAPNERRGEVISSYLLAVYFGNSIPVIGIGFLSAIATPFMARMCFAAVITILAVTAFGVDMNLGNTTQPGGGHAAG